MKNKEIFKTLSSIDVNSKVEKKQDLSYLSWAYAWDFVSKKYDDVSYEIKKFENNLPYVYDENTGYMVFTSVTINNSTHEMWLPVMDGANKAMKKQSYSYKTKYGEKLVQQCSMFDINKTIMRCLVKNLAMFGLGIYIYAGEDLPIIEKKIKKKLITKKILDNKKEDIVKYYKQVGEEEFLKNYECDSEIIKNIKLLKNEK